MHFFFAAPFEFMTRFSTMILYFRLSTGFTAGPNINWDVLHAFQFCTRRYSYGSGRRPRVPRRPAWINAKTCLYKYSCMCLPGTGTRILYARRPEMEPF